MNFRDLARITDPIDFKSTEIPQLSTLDSLLRCHICKEFMTAPMLTNCGHSFCSVCIRSYLIHTEKCPICSKELRESNLSRNILVEEVIVCFKDLRPTLIEKLTSKKEEDNAKSKSTDDAGSKKEEFPLTAIDVIEIDDTEKDDDDDDDFVIIEEKQPKKRYFDPKATGLDAFIKKPKTEKELGHELGQCPICSKKMPLKVLQSSHIDDCLLQQTLESESKTDTKQIQEINVPSPTPKRPTYNFDPEPREPAAVPTYKKMTKLDYSSLSTAALKQKMNKLELSVTGTRFQLESRYNQYLILWNANCDSIHPKDPRILRKQLSQWEGLLNSKVIKSDSSKADWNELIQKARGSLLKKKQPEKDAENKDQQPEAFFDQDPSSEELERTQTNLSFDTTVIEGLSQSS